MASSLVLVVNCGSASIKFALVNPHQSEFSMEGLAERLGEREAALAWKIDGAKQAVSLAEHATHKDALSCILPKVQAVADGRLVAIGHRVVHGGERFTAACVLDDEPIAAIKAADALAPLHNPANLLGIKAAVKLFPNLPHVAVFDTAFHQTLPDFAFRYAIPEQLYLEQGVRRYGFHGTSHRYVVEEAARLANKSLADSGWLTAHLGNGCSTSAVSNGQSVDTSMGFTPLEVLVMGTRSGDVDPNLHGFLHRELGWDLEKIDHVLNKESGLLGLSAGLSNDMRTLEKARSEGNDAARLAIDVFCYRLAKSLAGLACALKRLDGIIFTGGIGENSVLIREKTAAHLTLFGVAIDDERNRNHVGGKVGTIHQPGSPEVWVVPTNEERQIALETLACIQV